jgi:hypothetical protein
MPPTSLGSSSAPSSREAGRGSLHCTLPRWYGLIVEIFDFWCPLTALEEWLDVRGQVPAYHGPFLLHYLDAVVYPNIPANLLVAGAVAVCILNRWV